MNVTLKAVDVEDSFEEALRHFYTSLSCRAKCAACSLHPIKSDQGGMVLAACTSKVRIYESFPS